MKTAASDQMDSSHRFPVSSSVYRGVGSRSARIRFSSTMKLLKEMIEPEHDSTAPEIKNVCFVCGNEFKSPKALHGHMRKHPERSWRGCNPPSKIQRFSKPCRSQTPQWIDPDYDLEVETAFCLILLSEGKPNNESTTSISTASDHTGSTSYNVTAENSGGDSNLFRCTSYDKIFQSHQALGGHRESHKNGKGCFAITKSSPTTTTATTTAATTTEITSQTTVFGEKRQIQNESTILRGQGAHLRNSPQSRVKADGFRGLGIDLNLPAPELDDDDDDDDYYDSSPDSVSSYFRRFF